MRTYRSSQIKLAKECITRSYYQYILGLVPKRSFKPDPDLFFGSILHKSLEIFLTKDYSSALKYLDTLEFPARTQKTKRIARILLNLFRMKFKDQVVACEKPFKLKLSDDIELRGRYDLVAKDSDGIYIGEYKTTIPYYLLSKPDDQFIIYYLAGNQEFGNVEKVVLCNLDPNNIDVSLSIITYTKQEIEDWRQEMIAFLDYYQSCIDKKVLVKTPQACLAFGRRCEFYDLCTANSYVRDVLIKNYYTINEKALEY